MSIFIAIFFSIQGFTADYKYVDNGEAFLVLNGRISRDEMVDFKKQLSYRHYDGLLLQSRGGSVKGALEVAALVKKYNIDTYTETYCSSACLLILASGKEKHAYQGAFMGIHRPYKRKNDTVIPEPIHGYTYKQMLDELSRSLGKYESEYFMNMVFSVPSGSLSRLSKADLSRVINLYSVPKFI
ncbi:hypothetical protein ACGRL8_17880 [Vibrio rumoiensis]|uniref:Periplasmic protein n=1 Tax=Vibrio rumoiensis TaxID=76258 RepID=A0ABW7IZF2_9VIBR